MSKLDSVQFYKLIADFTYDWETLEAEDGTLQYVSPACHRISGYSPEEFYNSPSLFKNLILNEDQEKWINHRKNMDNPQKDLLQFRILHKNGSIRWIEHACQKIQIKGKDVGYRASNRDITERKEIELKCRESNEKFQKVFDSSPNAIILTHPSDGKILQVNEECEKILGFDEEFLIGKTTVELGIWDDLKDREKLLEKFETNEQFKNEIIRINHSSGEKKIVSLSGELLTIAGQKCAVTHVRDITYQRLLEEKFSLFMKHLPGYMYIKNKKGEYIYGNDNICELFKKDLNSVKKITDHDIMQDEPARQQKANDKVVRDTQKAHIFAENIETGESKLFIYTVKFPYPSDDGLLNSVAGISLDITKQKQLEEKIKENELEIQIKEKMLLRAQRLASLGELSAAIAHEIRQPLQVIKVVIDSSMYWAKETLKDGPGTENNLERFKTVSRSVDKINEIIKNLQSTVKQGGKTTVTQFNPHTVIENTLKLLRQRINNHRIQLIMKLTTKNIRISFSEVQFGQVVVNLITNAIKALDSCSISHKTITITTETKNSCFYLRIEDNGPKIKDEHLESLFDPLFTTGADQDSMGMGLFIVHTILDSFKSQIETMNLEPQGVAFIVKIPFEPEKS
jgi:PAS domain S-box-containing protein